MAPADNPAKGNNSPTCCCSTPVFPVRFLGEGLYSDSVGCQLHRVTDIPYFVLWGSLMDQQGANLQSPPQYCTTHQTPRAFHWLSRIFYPRTAPSGVIGHSSCLSWGLRSSICTGCNLIQGPGQGLSHHLSWPLVHQKHRATDTTGVH